MKNFGDNRYNRKLYSFLLWDLIIIFGDLMCFGDLKGS